MKSTFSVIYYLKRQVVKKDGTVPVMGRITVDGSQTQFSCKSTVDPEAVGYQRWTCHGQKRGCTRNEPYARQDARTHQQALSGNHGA